MWLSENCEKIQKKNSLSLCFEHLIVLNDLIWLIFIQETDFKLKKCSQNTWRKEKAHQSAEISFNNTYTRTFYTRKEVKKKTLLCCLFYTYTLDQAEKSAFRNVVSFRNFFCPFLFFFAFCRFVVVGETRNFSYYLCFEVCDCPCRCGNFSLHFLFSSLFMLFRYLLFPYFPMFSLSVVCVYSRLIKLLLILSIAVINFIFVYLQYFKLKEWIRKNRHPHQWTKLIDGNFKLNFSLSLCHGHTSIY